MSSALKKESNPAMDRVLRQVTDIVARVSGNVFGPEQHSMVVNRIKKRMLDLGGQTPEQYEQYLQTHRREEEDALISLLTTHHTFFFREFAHFEFLIAHMDQLAANVKARGDHTARIYSAASSRGQEVYSLAMLFKTHFAGKYPGISFEVFGTDIDQQSVAYGQNGVYPYNEVKSIPKMYLSGNWQRGTGDIAQFARVKPELKKYCSFAHGNLLELKKTLGTKKFDVVLCRNVLIYLTHEDNEKIVHDIKNYLHPHGILITGVSESLKAIKDAPTSLAPSVYTFDPVEAPKDKAPVDVVSTPAFVPAASKIPSPIRMLCVDDSPAIVKLLSKIFEKDPDFEVVGTAMNGIEAAEFLKNNEVDAMTLDIHMPEMDGVEYLKKHHHSKHPKVVVVSSASREDSRYALETLKHGATDFVEKPSLNNIGERADEIKMKLKMAFFNSTSEGPVSGLDKDFSKSFVIDDVDNKSRVLVGTFGHVESMCRTIKELTGVQPPLFMFFEGNENYLDGICERVKGQITKPTYVWDEGVEVAKNQVYICDFKRDMPRLLEIFKDKPTSIAIYGQCSKKALQSFMDFNEVQVLVEDSPGLPQDFKDIASDIFPASSFSHVGTEYLSDPETKKSRK